MNGCAVLENENNWLSRGVDVDSPAVLIFTRKNFLKLKRKTSDFKTDGFSLLFIHEKRLSCAVLENENNWLSRAVAAVVLLVARESES